MKFFVLLVCCLSTFATNNNYYASANTNVVSSAKSHKTHALKARNFNKVFEQYMKEAQVYMPSSNETMIENHFYDDDTNKDMLKNCEAEAVAFEFVYDHVLFAPHNVLESIGNVQSVKECQAYCKNNGKCRSFIFYDGGCIFLSATEPMLPAERFVIPESGGNYIYGEKYCQKQALKCGENPAQVYRFPGYKISEKFVKKTKKNVATKQACYELCVKEKKFDCRSANFNTTGGICELSDMNRFTVFAANSLQRSEEMIYLENNCVYEPKERCHFRTIKGQLPRHVDAFYEIDMPDDCKTLCLNATFGCRSYSVLNEKLCLLTHDTEKTRLAYDKAVSYPIEDAMTYEKLDCFDIKLDCRKDGMVLKTSSSKMFNGKIYSKGSPTNCVTDVTSAMNFELKVPYNDVACGVSQVADGYFMGDFVIQHMKNVLTVNDVWVSASCQFDLQSQTVQSEQGYAMLDSYALKNAEGAVYGKNEYKIDIHVEKPTIQFQVVHDNFTSLTETPNIGDALAVLIRVANESSPYDIFIRDLVAFDQDGAEEIQLINERGCPVEPTIMGAVDKVDDKKPVRLFAPFSAFKFPTSDTVQFRCLVSLCIPKCEPVDCSLNNGYYSEHVESRGRRRRSVDAFSGKNISKKDILLSHSLKISDIRIMDNLLQDSASLKLTHEEEQIKNSYRKTPAMKFMDFEDNGSCMTQSYYIFIGALIIAIEVILTIMYMLCCSNKRK
ncbi:uncharacterized protein LOC134835164 [Culicoides brevitarsis]|uniref:uncharacterized protein LOC134835164 n=1 Tax=Culicoides brevitarsis TaxID=469753 RepID=UPI00307C32CC